MTIHKGDTFQVKITGDDAEKVKVTQSGSELAIEYEIASSDGNCTILNNMNVGGSVSIGNIRQNNTIISGRGNVISGVNNTTIHTSGGKQVRIVDGEVFVNGVRVDVPESAPEEKYNPVEIEIRCPDGLAIDCTLNGMAGLNAVAQFHHARLTLAGSSHAKLASFSAKLNIAGSGKVVYLALKGDLKMQISGSGNILACGEFTDVEASVGGSGNIQTSGTVARDYDVDISGMGKLTHNGVILGRKRKSISGMGSVNW